MYHARVTKREGQAPKTAWLSLPQNDGGGTHMHLTQRDDGRWVVDELYLHAQELTPTMLRRVPIARADAMVSLIEQGDGPDFEYYLKMGPGEPSLGELQKRAELAEMPGFKRRDRLTRPDGSDPSGFYAQVAAAHRDFVAKNLPPGEGIAAEAGVPVTTAHRWIREARLRGYLPPGRRGRAG